MRRPGVPAAVPTHFFACLRFGGVTMSEFRSVNFCRVVSSFSLISLLAFSSAAMGDVARGVPFDGQELVPAIAKGQDLGATNPGQLLHVAVSLQPSWADGLQEFANAVSDP